MEVTLRIVVYLFVGFAILAANVWYARTIYSTLFGGQVVFAPVQTIGKSDVEEGLGRGLTQILLARLHSIAVEADKAQSSLLTDQVSKITPRRETTITYLGEPRTIGIDAKLFDPPNLNVAVAGVELTGVVSWVQRLFVNDRILTLTVIYRGDSAIISGNLEPLDLGISDSLWVEIDSVSPEEIAENAAYALLQKKLSKDHVELAALKPKDFKLLLGAISNVAVLNEKVARYGTSGRDEFGKLLPEIVRIADDMPKWDRLTDFAATIAEGADNDPEALRLYKRLAQSSDPEFVNAPWLLQKITELEQSLAPTIDEAQDAALGKIRSDAMYATETLNKLFGYDLPVPDIKLLDDPTTPNAYWDGSSIHVPPSIQHLPDVTYHEASWPFIQTSWKDFVYSGQSGALGQSYTDILTTLIKQSRLEQTEKTADWVIAPGATAWLRGENVAESADRRPLRSLKAPGTAYDDKILGKDAQVAHIRDLYTGGSDNGGIHINSGIPNKAFYEMAMQVGSKTAGTIWLGALPKFKKSVTLPESADIIYRTATELYGIDSAEAKAVKTAWSKVGIDISRK